MHPWTREEMTAVLRSPRWYDSERKTRELAWDIHDYCREHNLPIVTTAYTAYGLSPKEVRAVLAALIVEGAVA